MQHFKIYAEGETYQEPERHSLFAAGTQLLFDTIAGRVINRGIRIPVQFA